MLRPFPGDLPLLQLPGDRPVGGEGTGGKLWKQGDVKGHARQRALRLDPFMIDIQQIGKTLEGIEADAQRQQQLPAAGRYRLAGKQAPEGGEVVPEKAGVFEQDQPAEIIDQPQRQHQLPAGLAPAEMQAEPPVDQKGCQQQKHILRRFPYAVGIKRQAAQQQDPVFPADGDQTVDQKKQRRKHKQKRQTAEYHRIPPQKEITYSI